MFILVQCPKCNSTNTKIIDKGFKKILRFIRSNNRFVCKNCYITWREKTPEKIHKIKRRKTQQPTPA